MRALQLGVSFSNVAPSGLWEPLPIAAKESFELAPRTRNRATAAMTVVVADPGRAGELGRPRSCIYERRSTREEKLIFATLEAMFHSQIIFVVTINFVAPIQTAKGSYSIYFYHRKIKSTAQLLHFCDTGSVAHNKFKCRSRTFLFYFRLLHIYFF